MITKIQSFILYCLVLILVSCGGNGNCPTSQSNLYQLGTLPNNSTLFASSNTFTTPSSSHTSGTLTLSGGTSGNSYILSFGVAPSGPTVSCASTPCIITSGSNNTVQVNFNGNNQADGVYTISVYYTPLVTGTNKTAIGIALPNTISLTVTQNGGLSGNLSIAPLSIRTMEIGESQLATISLSDSSNITTPVLTTIAPENNSISITPTVCNLTTENNSCMVTITALTSGVSTFNASAANYTTITSESIVINPSSQFMIASGQTTTVDNYDPQTNRLNNLIASSVQLRGIAQKDSTIVIVGFNGAIFASYNNAQSWNQIATNVNKGFSSVISTSSKFFAVGDSGTIVSSTNGDTWDKLNSNTESTLNALSANGNNIIVIGNDGTILTSHNNGDTWINKKLSNVNSKLNSIINNGANFVIIGDQGTILVSHDNGDTWTNKTTGLNDLYAVGTLSNNSFAAVGRNGTVIVSNDNGNTWTTKTVPELGAASLTTIYGNENTFIIGGNSSASSGVIASSTDNGLNWSKNSITAPAINKISYFNNTWLAVGSNNLIIKSIDNGITWSNIAESNLTTATYINTLFNNNLIINIGNNSNIITSTNSGASWQNQTINKYASGINGIINNNSTFVIVGSKSVVSHDYGTSWNPINTTDSMSSIQNNDNTFIGVGNSGKYIKSIDNGLTWESGATSTVQRLSALANNNNYFVAVGNSSTIITSDDNGNTWNTKTSPAEVSSHFRNVLNNESTFIVNGTSIESILISHNNGNTWQTQTFTKIVNSVEYGNNTWMVVGNEGFISKSIDNGNTWTQITTEYVEDLTTLTNSNKVWVSLISGSDNILVSHDNGDTWTKHSLSTTTLPRTIKAMGKYFIIGLDNGSILISKDYAQTWSTISTNAGGIINYLYPYN